LKIKKTHETVSVENNSLIISLPQKEYQSLSIKTTNGNIIFDYSTSLTYNCSTENGNIKGILKGTETDYLIVTSVKNGKNNLNNNVIESSKTIEFDVKNGNIEIEFEN